MLREICRMARWFKKELDLYVAENWVTIMIGLIITVREVDRQYFLRGYLGYGGEWLILPMMLIVKYFIELGMWELRHGRRKQRKRRRSGRSQKRAA